MSELFFVTERKYPEKGSVLTSHMCTLNYMDKPYSLCDVMSATCGGAIIVAEM